MRMPSPRDTPERSSAQPTGTTTGVPGIVALTFSIRAVAAVPGPAPRAAPLPRSGIPNSLAVFMSIGDPLEPVSRMNCSSRPFTHTRTYTWLFTTSIGTVVIADATAGAAGVVHGAS